MDCGRPQQAIGCSNLQRRAWLVVASNFRDCELRSLTFAIVGVGPEIQYLFIAGSCLSPANEIAAVKRQICKRAEDEHRRLSHTV